MTKWQYLSYIGLHEIIKNNVPCFIYLFFVSVVTGKFLTCVAHILFLLGNADLHQFIFFKMLIAPGLRLLLGRAEFNS